MQSPTAPDLALLTHEIQKKSGLKYPNTFGGASGGLFVSHLLQIKGDILPSDKQAQWQLTYHMQQKII